MKVVCGLGNPGEEYSATRHNVGWWVVEAARKVLGFPAFQRDGRARVTSGLVDGEPVRLIRPITWMNRSGSALAPLRNLEGFDVRRDLLVISDDTALDVGRIRFRERGSSGGHNGLKSVEAALETQEYPRLRIGVGSPPPEIDQADWVLTPFSREDEERIRSLLPELADAVKLWIEEGTSAAANRYNR
jgi:PTH1 family peptidyl-tRNA hydrolase